MGVPNGGPKWGSQMGVPNGGPKWGSQMGVLNGGLKWESKSGSSVSKCQNIKMIKWPNDQMAKWPKGAIEGVNVHKVIPRPTALRAVGKNGCRLYIYYISLPRPYFTVQYHNWIPRHIPKHSHVLAPAATACWGTFLPWPHFLDRFLFFAKIWGDGLV
jgi:hypothetical protein